MTKTVDSGRCYHGWTTDHWRQWVGVTMDEPQMTVEWVGVTMDKPQMTVDNG